MIGGENKKRMLFLTEAIKALHKLQAPLKKSILRIEGHFLTLISDIKNN